MPASKHELDSDRRQLHSCNTALLEFLWPPERRRGQEPAALAALLSFVVAISSAMLSGLQSPSTDEPDPEGFANTGSHLEVSQPYT